MFPVIDGNAYCIGVGQPQAGPRARASRHQQAGRQGREHRRGRQAGGAEQVGDPVIADLEAAERAIRRIEQARAVEPAPEIRQRAALRRGRRSRRASPASGRSRPSLQRQRTSSAAGEAPARIAGDADHMQHRRVARPEQRAQRERHASGRSTSGPSDRIVGRPSRTRSSRRIAKRCATAISAG